MKLIVSFYCILLAGVFCSSIVRAQEQISRRDGAQFKFAETIHDFGEIGKDTAENYRFEFVNKGNSLLIVTDAAVSCPCFSADWKRGAIMPGEKGWVSIHYPIVHDGRFDKAIWLTSNAVNIDPNLGRFELRVRGNVVWKHAKRRAITARKH